MKRTAMKFLIALGSLSMPFAMAQGSSPPAPQDTVLSARTNLVLVPTLVTTKSGENVFTLSAKDFTVTDDGLEQKITLEQDNGDQPLALVVAVETGGAGARQLKNYGKLGPMIEAVVGNVPHKVAIVGFDSVPTLFRNFTPDLNNVGDAIHSLRAGNGGAAILDGLAFSVDMLRKQPPEYRRAILLISETIDHGSTTRLDEALRVISDTNTAIYSVAFSTSKAEMKHESSQIFAGITPPLPPGPPGGCMSKDPDADSVATENRFKQAFDCLSVLAPPLRALKMAALLAMNQMQHNLPETVARLTGGEYFSFNNPRGLERDLVAFSNRIANYYVLSFYPQSPHPGLHTIEVRLSDYPHVTVRARTNYWADTKADSERQP